MIDIDKLEQLAEAATPGPWIPTDTPGLALTINNMEYIASVDPTTVLALIAELRKLRAVVDATGDRSAAMIPNSKDLAICPECNASAGRWVTDHDQSCAMSEEPCQHLRRWVRCETCKGERFIARMLAAIYRARGGPAPAPYRKT